MRRLLSAQYTLETPMRLRGVAAAVLLMLVVPVCAAQTLNVKIIDRQDSATHYTYVVPGHSRANSKITVNCSGSESTANCSGATQTTASQIPAQIGSYEVRGATFSLQLPDGHIAVVNCEGKPLGGAFVAGWSAGAGERSVQMRGCRMPIVDDIQVEFKGNKAKLKWQASIDGKKIESETYKVLGVLDKPSLSPAPVSANVAALPSAHSIDTPKEQTATDDAQTQFHLGTLYETGKGVPQDYAQAVLWYRKAAEQNLPLAQLRLGVLYANGVGVPLGL